MGFELSLSLAGLRGIAKMGLKKLAGHPPDPAVTARPLVHVGRAASISTPVGRIGDKVSVRTVGGGRIYQVKNHGTAPALNLRVRISRTGEPVSLGDLAPKAMKPVPGVAVEEERRFWLEWTETDGGTRKKRKLKPVP